MLGSGIVFGSEPLLLPGIALLVIPIALTFWVWLSASGARVRRATPPGRVVEGAAFDLNLSLRSGLLPLVATLAEPALARPVPVRRVRPRGEFELVLEGCLQRRGRQRLDPPNLHFTDPLGIVSRQVGGGEVSRVLVLPRVEPIISPGGDGGHSLGPLLDGFGELARSAGRESPAEPELDGLRPYRAGTSATRIHWPALARHDELLERRLIQPGAGGPLVALDPSAPRDSESLDRAVRATASLCLHLARRGGCELLLPGRSRRFPIGGGLEGWSRAHTELALIEADAGAPDAGGLEAGAALFWVRAGAEAGAGVISAASARGYLITPEALAGRPIAFTVAGCHAHPLAASGSAWETTKAATG